MTEEEEKEEYLRKNGWWKINELLWHHKDANCDCCLEVAYEVQMLRNKDKLRDKDKSCLRKLKCYFGFHEEELQWIGILYEFVNTGYSHRVCMPYWICKYCKHERKA